MVGSRNKYSRARMRARIRRPKRRGGARWYYGVLAVIVVAGLAGIVASAGETDVHPLANQDHWHSSLAVNVCGEWIADAPEFHEVAGSTIQAGIHTHGDGFIHIHPYSSGDSGNNATLGRYFEIGGWEVAEDSFDVWSGPAVDPTQTRWSNGDECPAGSTMAGRTGVVKWSVNCAPRSGDPGEYKMKDLQVIALAFLPQNEDIGVPPNAFEAPEADQGQTEEALDVNACETTGPGGGAPTTTTSTTVVGPSPSTTTSTTP
jgi:hypothetical protein